MCLSSCWLSFIARPNAFVLLLDKNEDQENYNQRTGIAAAAAAAPTTTISAGSASSLLSARPFQRPTGVIAGLAGLFVAFIWPKRSQQKKNSAPKNCNKWSERERTIPESSVSVGWFKSWKCTRWNETPCAALICERKTTDGCRDSEVELQTFLELWGIFFEY